MILLTNIDWQRFNKKPGKLNRIFTNIIIKNKRQDHLRRIQSQIRSGCNHHQLQENTLLLLIQMR